VTISTASSSSADQAGAQVAQNIAILNNTSGQSSLDDQLQAFTALYQVGVANAVSLNATGQAAYAPDVVEQAVNAVGDSQITQRGSQLQAELSQQVIAAADAATVHGGYRGLAVAQAQLAFFDSLSSADRSILFTTGFNLPNGALKGAESPYASQSEWLAQQQASLTLGNYLASQNAQTAPPDDPAAAGNPTLKAALNIVHGNLSPAAYTSAIVNLLGGGSSTGDSISLSPEGAVAFLSQAGTASSGGSNAGQTPGASPQAAATGAQTDATSTYPQGAILNATA
jgi:hypothetical protein